MIQPQRTQRITQSTLRNQGFVNLVKSLCEPCGEKIL